jgi:8-oxo-dGTP diphosphatase
MTKQIHVVGAVIVKDGLVLCARRGQVRTLAGKWEFPGGKIETGETPEVALAREIREELGVDVVIGAAVEATVHKYDFGVVHLATFYCELVTGEPRSTEHADLRWVAPAALDALDWAPADIPAVRTIQSQHA